MKLPIPEFTAAVRPRLEALGLKKRAGEIYTIEVGPDVLGVVGLGRATEHGVLRIWPTVGVRHQPTEALLAALSGMKAHSYAPATIGCGLGYLMPVKRWTEWSVDDAASAEPRATEVANAIGAYGLPAIRANASLEKILEAMTSRQPMGSVRTDYALPVVLAELDRPDEAATEVGRHLEKRRGHTYPEADQYRAFADAFGKWQAARR